jgi:hypothetical protein
MFSNSAYEKASAGASPVGFAVGTWGGESAHVEWGRAQWETVEAEGA